MNLNPYLIETWKALVAIETKRCLKLDRPGNRAEIKRYIANLKTHYGAGSVKAKTFAEYINRRLFYEDVYQFTPRTLNMMCEVLVTTLPCKSWQDFEQHHDNLWARICEKYTYTHYGNLKGNIKEEIAAYVSTTLGLHLAFGAANQENFETMFDSQKLIEKVSKNVLRFDKATLAYLQDFAQQNPKIFRSCIYGALVAGGILAKIPVAKVLLLLLLAGLIDISIFLFLTRQQAASPLKIAKALLHAFWFKTVLNDQDYHLDDVDGSPYKKPDLTIDDIEVKFSFPKLVTIRVIKKNSNSEKELRPTYLTLLEK